MAGTSPTLVESFKGNVKKLKLKELSLDSDDVRGANEREEKFLRKTLGSLERARNKRLSRIEIEVKELQHTLVEQNSVTPSVFCGFAKPNGNDVIQQKYCSDARKLTSRLLGLENRKISTDTNPKCVKKALNMWIEKAIRKAATQTPEPHSKPRPTVDSGGVKQEDLQIKQPLPPRHKETLDDIQPKPRRLLLRQRSTPNTAGTLPLVAPPQCNSPSLLRRTTSSSEIISISSPLGTIERKSLSGGCKSFPESFTKNRVHFSTPDIHDGKRRSGRWSVESSPCITRRDHTRTVPGLVSPISSPMLKTKGLKTVRSCPTLRSAHAQQVQVFSNPARSTRPGSYQRLNSKNEHIPQLSVARNNRGVTSSPDLKFLDLENEGDTPLPYLRPRGKCRSDSDINRKEWNSSPLEQHLSDDRLNFNLQERVDAFLASLETSKNDDHNPAEP